MDKATRTEERHFTFFTFLHGWKLDKYTDGGSSLHHKNRSAHRRRRKQHRRAQARRLGRG